MTGRGRGRARVGGPAGCGARWLSVLLVLGGCGGGGASEGWLPEDFPAGFVEVRSCRGSAEHFPRIRISVPLAAAAAYEQGPYPFAAGTLLVKEEFTDAGCKARSGYTLMRKTPGADPARGDWQYQRLDARGEVVATETRGCASCHALCATRDFACAE